LQVGETLKGKLAEDGKLKVRKKEIRALVGEVADRLCHARNSTLLAICLFQPSF
jgi:hypothetical protein